MKAISKKKSDEEEHDCAGGCRCTLGVHLSLLRHAKESDTEVHESTE